MGLKAKLYPFSYYNLWYFPFWQLHKQPVLPVLKCHSFLPDLHRSGYSNSTVVSKSFFRIFVGTLSVPRALQLVCTLVTNIILSFFILRFLLFHQPDFQYFRFIAHLYNCKLIQHFRAKYYVSLVIIVYKKYPLFCYLLISSLETSFVTKFMNLDIFPNSTLICSCTSFPNQLIHLLRLTHALCFTPRSFFLYPTCRSIFFLLVLHIVIFVSLIFLSSVLFHIRSDNQSFLRGFLYPKTPVRCYCK